MSSRLIRWLPLAIWIAVIFGLSSIPGITADNVNLPTGFDKMAHFIEYAVLAVLFYRGLSYDSRKPGLVMILVVVLTGTAVSVLDEMYQSYIPGRDSSPYDMMADVAGVAFGSVLAVLFQIRKAGRGSRR